jgi:polyphosphate kinase
MSPRRAGAAESRSRSKRERTPEIFFNRELSWLAFNERVAEEAEDRSNPLLERAKFAAIVASNLDEFFMVRVARLRNAIEEGDTEPDSSGLSPAQQLAQVSARVHALVDRLYALVTGELLPALAANGIRIASPAELESELERAPSARLEMTLLRTSSPAGC